MMIYVALMLLAQSVVFLIAVLVIVKGWKERERELIKKVIDLESKNKELELKVTREYVKGLKDGRVQAFNVANKTGQESMMRR